MLDTSVWPEVHLEVLNGVRLIPKTSGSKSPTRKLKQTSLRNLSPMKTRWGS